MNFDGGSFMEIQAFATGRMSEHVGDGVVTGTGLIHGRPVCVYAQDATVHGGSLGEIHAKKLLLSWISQLRIRCRSSV